LYTIIIHAKARIQYNLCVSEDISGCPAIPPKAGVMRISRDFDVFDTKRDFGQKFNTLNKFVLGTIKRGEKMRFDSPRIIAGEGGVTLRQSMSLFGLLCRSFLPIPEFLPFLLNSQ
jgi:hypothetical protein